LANLKSPGTKKKILIICAALALCIPLLLVAQGDKGKGNKGGKSSMCQTVTADAEFRDTQGDGIRSGVENSIHGDKKYYGNEDALVCLLKGQDHDFILSTMGGTKYERASGIDRKVTLDFGANGNPAPPFDSLSFEVDPLIRVDEVLSDDPEGYTDQPKRFIMWFSVGRDNYRLVFDGLDESEYVSVTQTGTTPERIWTIISTDKARLEYDHRGKRYTVGHFVMPFQITVLETEKDPTCL
jgi:hypothetical protein